MKMPMTDATLGVVSRYGVHKAKHMIAVPEASPEVVAMLTSGLTASIALEQAGMRSKQVILVTAAAGGTGQFAVQVRPKRLPLSLSLSFVSAKADAEY